MQELKDLHARLMAIIKDNQKKVVENYKRLVRAMDEELLRAQVNIERQCNQQDNNTEINVDINGDRHLLHDERAEDACEQDMGDEDIGNEDGKEDKGLNEKEDDVDGDDDEGDDDDKGEGESDDRSFGFPITVSDFNEHTPNPNSTTHKGKGVRNWWTMNKCQGDCSTKEAKKHVPLDFNKANEEEEQSQRG